MSGSTSVVPYTQKKKSTTVPAIDATNDIQYPLDYSFCRLNKVEDAEEEEPRLSPRKGHAQEPEGGKSLSRCIRLNNNNLQTIEKLCDVLTTKFENPNCIGWIDLSFNELTTIDPVLQECKELQILYLHGNQIGNIEEVDNLFLLPVLKKLTLHGNPMEKKKGYKCQVLSKLPNLLDLDFSRVTKADRKTAQTWSNMNSATKKKKEKMEDDE